MIDNVFNLIFRCRHKRLSRPVTPLDSGGGPEAVTYITCLDCGGRFAYDTHEMRMGKRIESRLSGPYADLLPDEPPGLWQRVVEFFGGKRGR